MNWTDKKSIVNQLSVSLTEKTRSWIAAYYRVHNNIDVFLMHIPVGGVDSENFTLDVAHPSAW
jgi:Mn-dependent DtxR family transcriptional regulator